MKGIMDFVPLPGGKIGATKGIAVYLYKVDEVGLPGGAFGRVHAIVVKGRKHHARFEVDQ